MIKFFKKKNKNKKAEDQQTVESNNNEQPTTQVVEKQSNQDSADVNHESSVIQTEPSQVESPPKELTQAELTQAEPNQAEPTEEELANVVVPPELLAQGVEPRQYLLSQQLSKTNDNFGKKMKSMLSLKKQIDEDLFEELETTLLMADVGATATMDVIEKVRKSLKRRNLSDSDAVFDALKEQLTELAQVVEQPLVIDTTKQPFVILVVGVNGVGKTTTIAKLARKYKGMGKKVMLAAGDTFRAAAVEQLKTWGQREDIPVMAQKTGADSASVIFDAMTSAKAKNIDVLIADTAGRLHTQANLMQELEKISRVIRKNDETAPHETLIVIDGGTGQNAISQVREFNKANELSGVVITKLDGTPKGGVLFNLAAEFGIPVRFIGVGEKSTDLKPFIAKDFVDAIIS